MDYFYDNGNFPYSNTFTFTNEISNDYKKQCKDSIEKIEKETGFVLKDMAIVVYYNDKKGKNDYLNSFVFENNGIFLKTVWFTCNGVDKWNGYKSKIIFSDDYIINFENVYDYTTSELIKEVNDQIQQHIIRIKERLENNKKFLTTNKLEV